MSSVILEAHDLTKEYRHTVALDHIDLKIEKGKIKYTRISYFG